MAQIQVPSTTICHNRECGHQLSSHDGTEVSVQMLKSRVFPCLYFDKDGGTFAVCACRDFELPALGTSGLAAETPDEPVERLETTRNDLVLLLWKSGRVTWESAS